MLRSGRLYFLAASLFVAVAIISAPTHSQIAPPGPPAASGPSPAEPFAEKVILAEQTIVFMQGSGNWDSAYETLTDAFKNVHAVLNRLGLKPAGRPMTIYTGNDDAGFRFQAAIPIAAPPKTPPRGDIAMGQSPGGHAVKFVHRGSYETIDNTYEAIVNYLDEKNLDSRDIFIEEYVTDPLTTPENQLVINVYVPLQ